MINKKIVKLQSNNIKQYKKTYHSTIYFDKFLRKEIQKSKYIIDIGCGPGGTLSYYIKKYKNTKFLGIDYDDSNIKFCKKRNKFNNAEFLKFNILNLSQIKRIKNKLQKPLGIISEKTLLNFDKFENYFDFCSKLNPQWIAINSLFTDFNVNLRVHHDQFEFNKKNKKYEKNFIKYSHNLNKVNIYSINFIKNYIKKKNYKIIKVIDFFPPKKIKRSKYVQGGGGGSYTIKTEFNKNTLFHGPLFLPWKFVLIKKI